MLRSPELCAADAGAMLTAQPGSASAPHRVEDTN